MSGSGEVDVWMPLMVGDVLKKTSGLSGAETGAYVLLLMHAWCVGDGYVPNDAGRLARITRCSPSEWARVSRSVLGLFTLDGVRGWFCPDLVRELDRARRVRASKAEGGRRGAAARWSPGEVPEDLFDGMAIGSAIGLVNGNSHSDVSPTKQGKRRRGPRRPLPPGFSVSDEVRAWNKGKGYPAEHLELHLAVFRTKAAAHGYVYANWDAAFMEAIREDWAGARVAGGGKVAALGGGRPAWWATDALAEAEGRRVGVAARVGESRESFHGRIREAIALEERRRREGEA